MAPPHHPAQPLTDIMTTDRLMSDAPAATFLHLEQVTKRYGDLEVVSAFNLAVPKGELVALLGPSGCGKTTTLRMIAGLVSPSSGRIVVAGRDVTTVPPDRRDMGLVFQSYALFPHMTVAENVAFGLDVRSVSRAEKRDRVGRALQLVQLQKLADRRPRELSGGQQQRVALARALVIEPAILLLDEPLSNLDAKLRDEMRAQIRDIQQQLGITTVFVTHDQVEALSMCDRIVVMKDGRMEQVGTPVDIYEHPRTTFVASFVGRTNRIAGERSGERSIRFGGVAIEAANTASGDSVEVMVRPHRVGIDWTDPGKRTNDDNTLEATLKRITFVGDMVQYHFDAGGFPIVAEEATTGAHRAHQPGDRAWLRWKIADTLMFGDAA